MKVLKLFKDSYGDYYVVFDEIPEMTFEKIGNSYIGSAVNEQGEVITSRHLSYSNCTNAFGGREINLKMKGGTTETIKDHWWDVGHYKPHGEFINIGAGTIKDLQECYVYCSLNIGKKAFESMLHEYYTREKNYGYREIEEWIGLQTQFYQLKINNYELPIMVNEMGRFFDKETKERRHIDIGKRIRRYKKNAGKVFYLPWFGFSYKENRKLIKIEGNLKEVLRECTPFSDEKINEICGITQ